MKNKHFKVGVFKHGRRYAAYTLWYNKEWEGCREFDVMAPDGKTAKRLAIEEAKSIDGEVTTVSEAKE